MDLPDKRRTKINYSVRTDKIFIHNDWMNIDGKILVTSFLYPSFSFGDRIEIQGRLQEPPVFEQFSYKNYLSLSNIYSVMFKPRLKLIENNNGSIFFKYLFHIKETFETQLNKLFSEPMASFEAGLLTGSRKGIPENLTNAFNITGLTHIIAISGYNISLIIILISSLFKNVSRRIKIPIIITFIVIFTLFVGASAAVVRAAIMGMVSMIALWMGRQSIALNTLLISAFVMTLINPGILLYDVGFQLSFLATLGLILTGSHLQKIFAFMPGKFGIQEAFAMTLSAQIFALPVILFNFKRFSLVSPLANILVAPFIPFAMLFGFISTITSFLIFKFGLFISFFAWIFLKIIIITTYACAKIPFASIEITWFSIYHLILYYLLLLIPFNWKKIKSYRNKLTESLSSHPSLSP